MEEKQTVTYYENLEKYPLTGYKDTELRILYSRMLIAEKQFNEAKELYEAIIAEGDSDG